MTHPLFLDYGLTSQKDFSLILIIGREPNRNSICDKSHGQFDFDEFPKCAFWNIAFKTLGAHRGLNTVQVKHLFRTKNTSPLVFTDASPKAIENKVPDKNSIRQSLSDSEIADHVESILANEKLMSRVKLVLLSGLDGPKFERFRTLFRQQITARKIPMKAIPFFFGNNYPKILKEIAEPEIQIINGIFDEYDLS